MPTDHTPDLQALLLHEATVEDEACDSKAHEASPPMPCPFCGVAPSVEHRRSGWRIACNNDNCPTRPDGFSYETRAEAVEVWNSTPFATALTALKEWRKADREMSEYDHQLAVSVMCHERVGLEESRRLAHLKAIEFGRRHALRAVVDALEDEG